MAENDLFSAKFDRTISVRSKKRRRKDNQLKLATFYVSINFSYIIEPSQLEDFNDVTFN
jgi:hypothetical protein